MQANAISLKRSYCLKNVVALQRKEAQLVGKNQQHARSHRRKRQQPVAVVHPRVKNSGVEQVVRVLPPIS